MFKKVDSRRSGPILYSKNMTFEPFYRVISLSINLLFLLSDRCRISYLIEKNSSSLWHMSIISDQMSHIEFPMRQNNDYLFFQKAYRDIIGCQR